MPVRIRVPHLSKPNLVIRLARNQEEIEAANRLVCTNYVQEGYWDDDAPFWGNPHMHSPLRNIFVAVEGERVLATASVVRDSHASLPLDSYQPFALRTFRAQGERLAEVSALALSKDCQEQRSLVLFLFKYVYQYSFYYAGVDRLVIACTAKHALFYKAVCCFSELPWQGEYEYNYVHASVKPTLLTLQLFHAHLLYFNKYEAESGVRNNFYRFLLVDSHPNLRFPDKQSMCRSRDLNWVSMAQQQEMLVAA